MAGHTSQSDRKGSRAAFDRTARASRAGSVGWVFLVAILLVGAAAGSFYVGAENAERYVFALLALLATAGTFCLFALAAGILRFGLHDRGNPVLKGAIDNAFEAIIITEPN